MAIRRTALHPVLAIVFMAWACSSAPANRPARPPGKPFGDISAREVDAVAGIGRNASTGDGGPALRASLEGPGSLVFDRHGNLYVAERRRIRRVEPDGTITTFAGNGRDPSVPEGAPSLPRGDAGPARRASVQIPAYLSFGPDGGLYFVEPLATRIRRVAPDGIIDTVVGSGRAECDSPPTSYEGRDPRRIAPCWFSGVTFLPNGDMVFADNNQLWRVHENRISHFAGRVEGLDPFRIGKEGGPARTALFASISDIVARTDGSVYIAEKLDGRIRVVTPGGRASTFADGLGEVSDLFFHRGKLFAVSSDGLFGLGPDGSAEHYLGSDGLGWEVFSLIGDGDDTAMDSQGNFYARIFIEGYSHVVRVYGPFE